MTEPTAPEPTMEEILTSIRQIISEDIAPAGVAAADDDDDDDDDDDVLVLTDRAPPEASPFAPPPDSGPEPEPEPAPPANAAPPGHPLTLAAPAEGAVLARETADSVAASFERLSYVVETKPRPPAFAVATGGATLEDITRELLKPVLKAWLDENLADIVRARVDEEVERITRGRVR